MLLDGRPISGSMSAHAARLGLRYVTDDRLGEGTVAGFPVSTNFLLKQIGERAVLAVRHRAAGRDPPRMRAT